MITPSDQLASIVLEPCSFTRSSSGVQYTHHQPVYCMLRLYIKAAGNEDTPADELRTVHYGSDSPTSDSLVNSGL